MLQSRWLILLLLLVTKTRAAEIQADGAIDTRIGLARKWDVLVHNRSRVRAKQNDWYDISIIPLFRFQATDTVQLIAGAFLSRLEYPDGWKNVGRPFLAVEPRLIRKERFAVSSRSAYERFFIFRGADYNRYRQRFRVTRDGLWAPYASAEGFYTNHGWATTRYGAGLKRNLGKRDSIEFGYWYETKRFIGPGARHMFLTTFTVNFQGFAPDL